MRTKPVNYTSFGMDVHSAATRWRDVIRGPTSDEVRAHVAKLATFLEHLK